MKEPVARGVVVALPVSRGPLLAALAKESLSILKALDAPSEEKPDVAPDADMVLLLVEEQSDVERLALPDLKDRAAVVAAVGEDAPSCRVAIARARKHLRARGAVLGARELVFSPEQFGYLGLESDGLREKLEILLHALVADGERLRLRREGWEEPEDS